MTHDPEAWAMLGGAIRADRERQGLTREQLAERVRDRGAEVSSRSITTLEEGPAPKRGTKRPTLEPTVAALGWLPGWTDRILAGESASVVLQRPESESPEKPTRSHLLELVPSVYEFSRTAASLGAPTGLRDEFDRLVQQMLAAVTADKRQYGLAAYRPHAVGEGVPADDAARIRDALNAGG